MRYGIHYSLPPASPRNLTPQPKFAITTRKLDQIQYSYTRHNTATTNTTQLHKTKQKHSYTKLKHSYTPNIPTYLLLLYGIHAKRRASCIMLEHRCTTYIKDNWGEQLNFDAIFISLCVSYEMVLRCGTQSLLILHYHTILPRILKLIHFSLFFTILI